MEHEERPTKQDPDNSVVAQLYNPLIQLCTEKTNNPIQKWAKGLNERFSKEDTQIGQKAHEKKLNTAYAQTNGNQKPTMT